MTLESLAESLSRTQQAVLLGVVVATRDDLTPIQTHELRRVCRTHLETGETAIVGTLSEADVMRSLYALEAEDVVEEIEMGTESPTGKGRPAYDLAVSSEAVLEAVDDELLEETL